MPVARYCQQLIVVTASLGILMPMPLLARTHDKLLSESTDTDRAPGIRDLELGPDSGFVGVVIHADGTAARRVPVTLRQGRRLARQVFTDADGHFRFDTIRGGLYQLAAGESTVAVRAWTNRAAPPHASSMVTLVSGGDVVRGQRPLSELFVYDPVLLGIIVAAAIAIPIAVHNSRSAS